MIRFIFLFIILSVFPLLSQETIPLESGLMLRKRVEVTASSRDVFNRLSTAKGLEMFFSPKARVDLAVNGTFELFFNPDAPPGQRGSEGCRILSFVPGEMLSFSWNNPTHLPSIRNQKSWVVITLTALADTQTQVDLIHLGFRVGPEWAEALKYFDRQWTLVLRRLVHSFQVSPIDWAKPFTPDG